MSDVSYRTAIRRNKPSTPMQDILITEVRPIRGNSWLDYGCGRGDDIAHLKTLGFDVDGYDPHFQPKEPTRKYDYVSCIYVLNVLSPIDVNITLLKISKLLKDDGLAYIAVRRDIESEGFTSIGTQQWLVKLRLNAHITRPSYIVYNGDKNDIIRSCDRNGSHPS